MLAQRVVAYARTDFPGIHVYLCSAHRSRNMTEESYENRLKYSAFLKQYADETPDCHFIDVFNYPPFVEKDVFISDGVHLSPEGYELYAQMFREALKDELAKY